MKPRSWWEQESHSVPGCKFRMELMEALKYNERPVGLLTKAEQEVMRECEVEYFTALNRWIKLVKGGHLATHCTHRVRADFKPEYAPEPNTPAGEDWPHCSKCGQPVHPNIPCQEAAELRNTAAPGAEFVECEVCQPVMGCEHYHFPYDGLKLFHEREDIPGYGGYQVEGDCGWYYSYCPLNERGVAKRPVRVRFWRNKGGDA